MEKNKDTQIEVDDRDFKEKVLEASKKIPIVVDFWADWCMPCLMLSPTLESLAKEYNGKFILAKGNIDEVRETASKYKVQGIPSVKMFKNGQIVAEFVGALPEDDVREWLDKNL
jgi:putative thioredoxin